MKNITQRIEYIRKRNEAAKKNEERRTYSIKNWRGSREPLFLPIVEIDTDYLMYRLENSRTEIQQLTFLREHPMLQPNFFSDPESEQAQIAQESILTKLNNKSGKEFLDDLKTRGQEDPGIITYDGYLINGNRRTAALKSLGERYIKCVVLPEDTSPRDIYELEQELQIAEDFREDYHWINELKNIRKGLEDKRFEYSESEIAKRLRIDVKELRSKRKMLELIDSFLIWKGIEGQYDYPKLEDTEQIFIELEKSIKKYKEPQKLIEFRNSIFTLIEDKPLKGRLYGHVINLIKNFDQVYKKIQETQPKPQENPNLENKVNSEPSIIDKILQGDNSSPTNLFSNASEANKLSSLILEKISDVKAENKEKTDNEAVYESISTALRELQGLSIDNESTKLESAKSKLEQIISIATLLLQQVKNQIN